ncbi:MAG: M16 family metallopeptidase [Candidatus Eiseniibacteriota bacterium]
MRPRPGVPAGPSIGARGLMALVALLVTGSVASPHAAAAAAAGQSRAPVPVIRTLENGLTVAVFEDDRLPLVQIQLLVRAGSAQEPAGEAGVANLTFRMLSQGTASRPAGAFDDAVQALGGSVGGSVSREFTTVNGAFLATDMEAGLELLADAVLHPLLGDEQLAVIKEQVAARLEGMRPDPATLADDHLWGTVFRDHPYGRPPFGAPRALNALGVAQVRAFHRARYRPDQALLAIAGAVTSERAEKAAEELLGSWGGRAADAAPAVVPPGSPGVRVRIVDVPDLARAELRIGAVGPSRAEADYDPLSVAGELLAYATTPVLRAGLTGLRSAGLFSVASSSPADSAGDEVARLRAAVARGLAEPPHAAALEGAKRRIAARFALQSDTRGGLIAQWMAATVYAGAGDRAAGQADRIGPLTGDAVRAAFTRYLTPDRLALVAVGPAERLRPQLERFGPVEIVPAAAATEVIELPSTAKSPPTAEQVAKGRDLAGRAVAAHGGLVRLRGIKDSTLEGDVVVTPGPREQTGKVLQVRKDPDRFLFSFTIAAMKSVQVLDRDRAWSQTGDGTAAVDDLDSVSVAGLRSGNRSDTRHLLLAAADPGSRVAWRGRERRDEKDTDVLEVVSAEGERRLLFLDPEDQRLVAMEQNDGGHSVQRIYRDLRRVDGVLWPFHEERLLDGQRTMTFALSRVAFNTGVSDALFLPPGSKPATRPRPR